MFPFKPILSTVLLGLASLTGLTSCCDSSNKPQEAEIHALADLAGKRTAFLAGSMFQSVLEPLQPGIAE